MFGDTGGVVGLLEIEARTKGMGAVSWRCNVALGAQHGRNWPLRAVAGRAEICPRMRLSGSRALCSKRRIGCASEHHDRRLGQHALAAEHLPVPRRGGADRGLPMPQQLDTRSLQQPAAQRGWMGPAGIG